MLTDEQIARLFHDTYERLAPSFGYETRKDTKQFDPASPNGRLMTAVCGEVARALADKDALRDAERYRWLSRAASWPWVRDNLWQPISSAEFDAAIDAAIARSSPTDCAMCGKPIIGEPVVVAAARSADCRRGEPT